MVVHIFSLELPENWWYRVFLCAESKFLIGFAISLMVPMIFTDHCLKALKKIGVSLVLLHIISMELPENWWYRVTKYAESESGLKILIGSTGISIFNKQCSNSLILHIATPWN